VGTKVPDPSAAGLVPQGVKQARPFAVQGGVFAFQVLVENRLFSEPAADPW
jgi:hypothetical protein